jgi:membrane protease YdiL (CAAX protease family)
MNMQFLKSLFWNSHQRRLRALWRLGGQLAIMLVLLLPLQIVLALAGLALFLVQQGITPEQLSDPQAWQRALEPPGVQSFILESPGLILASSLETALACLVSVWLAGRWLDRRPFADFGLHFNRDWWLDFSFGLGLGAFLMLVIFLVELAAGWVTVGGTWITRDPEAFFPLALLPPLATFLAVGFYEELLSRGYQLRNLAEGLNGRALGPRGALVLATLLSSAVFGMLHVLNPHASLISSFNISVAGALLLAMGYLLTGELAIPIGVHITWNFFQGNVFGFPVSGGNFASATLVSIRQGGPDLWTGGAFGPEAGLLGLGAMLLGGLLIAGWVRWRYGRAGLHTALAEAPQRPEKVVLTQ